MPLLQSSWPKLEQHPIADLVRDLSAFAVSKLFHSYLSLEEFFANHLEGFFTVLEHVIYCIQV